MMSLYVLFEADIHLRPLHTFILDIYKALEPLVCCLKCVTVHPYRYTGQVGPKFGNSGSHLWSGNDVIMSWLRMISTSDHIIHPYLICAQCLNHWYAVSRAYGCILMPLHQGSWPQLGIQVYMWSENYAITSNLRLISTLDPFCFGLCKFLCSMLLFSRIIAF